MGYDHVKQDWMASPSDKPIEVMSPSKLYDKINKYIISSTEEYAKSIRKTSSFSFQGWVANAAANFAMQSADSFTANSVLFLASRRMLFGYDGWKRAPRMTQEALKLVCNPEQWIKTYGTYHKVGQQTGAYMRIKYTVTQKDHKKVSVNEAKYFV